MSVANTVVSPTAVIVSNPNGSSRTFFQGLFDTYARLSSFPVAFLIFVLASLSLVAHFNHQVGPFEFISQELEKFIENDDASSTLVSIAKILLSGSNFFINNSPKSYLYLYVLVIYLVYKDKDITLVLILLSGYVFVSSAAKYVQTALSLIHI